MVPGPSPPRKCLWGGVIVGVRCWCVGGGGGRAHAHPQQRALVRGGGRPHAHPQQRTRFVRFETFVTMSTILHRVAQTTRGLIAPAGAFAGAGPAHRSLMLLDSSSP